MKVVLTNLSNKLFNDSRNRLNHSAKMYGIEHINSYDFDDLKQKPFYQQHINILQQPKGIGYWLWKPYIILETLNTLSEGDIVVYSDCGIEFINKIDPLINICTKEQPIVLFANGNFKNKQWTKRDCFVLMDCDSKEYWNATHCDAAFSLFRKCDQSIFFLTEWLRYGADERIITDLPNTCKKNLLSFVEHRWDQSVLSLLAKKLQVPLHRMPSQFGNHYKTIPFRVANEFNCVNQYFQKQVNYYAEKPYSNSSYGQLLNHHRTKTGENNNSIKEVGLMRIIGKLKKLQQQVMRRLRIEWL